MSRRHRYALTGTVLSLGAPFGLFVARRAYQRDLSRATLPAEIARDPVSYGYVGLSMAIVFSLFGYALGRSADRLEELSETDALTGLCNARGLTRRLASELARTRRYYQPLSLVLLDLDGLKRINDQWGHWAGDQALRNIGDAIRSQLRESDIGARWGGDEFAIVAPNTDSAAARSMAERIRTSVAASEVPPRSTCSAGVATTDEGNRDRLADPSALMRSADLALYAAKNEGRNRVSTATANRAH